MNEQVTILHALILVPILGVFAIIIGMPSRGTAWLTSAVNLILGLAVWWTFDRSADAAAFQMSSEHVFLESPKLALAFGVDGMSVIMLLLSVIVTLCAVWLSPPASELGEHEKLYYICPLLIAAGALGAFLSTDLFFFYAFHELALIPTFLMIGMLGHGSDRVNVAWRITIYLGVGSMVLLAGLLALLIGLGGETFDMRELQTLADSGIIGAESQKWIFGTLLIGFGILISLFPFHSWAAPAYAAAPTPVAMLHAGVLKKFGLYGLLRVAVPMLPEGMEAWTNVILILLLGNILYIGFVTISQNRIDRMLGYSSVMHMGYVFLGIVANNVIGLNGAILLMFAHGVGIALLFGLTGQLRQQLPTLNWETLGGLGKNAPFYCFAFGIAAFASIGLPGFASFTSEVMVFFGGFKEFDGEFKLIHWTTILAIWGVVISAVYMLRGFRNVFLGQSLESRQLSDPTLLSVRVPICFLIAVLIGVGVFPSVLLDLLKNSF